MPYEVRYGTVVLLNNGTTFTATDGTIVVSDDAAEKAEQVIHEGILDQWRILLAAHAPFDLGECVWIAGPYHPDGSAVGGRVCVAAREVAALQTVVRGIARVQSDAPEADPGGVDKA